jgi:hypothetical protein
LKDEERSDTEEWEEDPAVLNDQDSVFVVDDNDHEQA